MNLCPIAKRRRKQARKRRSEVEGQEPQWGELPDRQREMYLFIDFYRSVHGRAPRMVEIQAFFGYANCGSVQPVLTRLQRRGFINRIPHYHRSIETVGEIEHHFHWSGNGGPPKSELCRQVEALSCDDGWGEKLGVLRREIAAGIARAIDAVPGIEVEEIVMVLEFFRQRLAGTVKDIPQAPPHGAMNEGHNNNAKR